LCINCIECEDCKNGTLSQHDWDEADLAFLKMANSKLKETQRANELQKELLRLTRLAEAALEEAQAVVEEIKVPEVLASVASQLESQLAGQLASQPANEVRILEEGEVINLASQVVVVQIPVPPPPQAAPQAVPQALAVVEEIEAPDAPPCPTCGETCGETVTLDHRTHMFSHHRQEMALMTLVGSKTISCTLCDFNLPNAHRWSAGQVARHVALYHDEITNCANQEEREWLKIMDRWRVAQSSLKRKATTAPAAAAAAKRSKVIHKCDCCDYETPHRSAIRNHLISVRHAMKAAARKR
jgi:hypothetical protein